MPSGPTITTVALGALVVNFTCAFLLAKFRENQQSLVMAAYLSARNDALANLAIITAGIVTAFWLSPVPDLVVGITIGMLMLMLHSKYGEAPSIRDKSAK